MHWQSGAIRSRLGNPGDIPRLPFMCARLQNVEMDLGVLEKWASCPLIFGGDSSSTCHKGGFVISLKDSYSESN